MALVGLVSGGHAKGVKTLAGLGPDAALVSGLVDPAAVQELAKGLDGEMPWGTRLPSLNEEEAQALEEGGCDMVALSLQGATVAAAASENMARVLCIEMDVDADQLPAIGALPVDAPAAAHGRRCNALDAAGPGGRSQNQPPGEPVHPGRGVPASQPERVGSPAQRRSSRPGGGRCRNEGQGVGLPQRGLAGKCPARSPSGGTVRRPWCPRRHFPAASPPSRGNRGPRVAAKATLQIPTARALAARAVLRAGVGR